MADEKKDNTLTFEELGVDRLFIDEAQYFKNLFYVSKMTRIAGLPQTASERAFDLFLKTRYIQQVNGGGGVVFATGTPISNSMAEMFTMQRYLQMAALTKLHVHHFDSWAATFGEPVTAMELAPDGAGYRLNTRFARFVNVPELMQQFRQVADIQTAQTLKLPTPALRNGKAAIIRAPATPELKALVSGLAERAEKLRKGRVDPRVDNMLKITTEGRKAALDLRLVDASARDQPESKANLAVHEIFRIWQETKADRLTQLVFCDLSTPKDAGFSVYNDVQAKLVIAGVPVNEIAFIQDYDSDAAKLALFNDVRAGRVRILMGSTQKMGSGTNVQARLVALHHLDAPWRPADVEQREGRILRQGNRNTEVQIYRYVTEGSFDAYMWQTLETKAKFIHQVMTGRNDLRRIEDIDGAALTYAEVKAIASGNPLVIEKAHIDAELSRLSRLRAQHHETQYRIRNTILRTHEEVEILTSRIQNLHKDIAARQPTQGDAFKVRIEGTEYTDRGIAGELINRRAQQLRGSGKEHKIGELAGFAVVLRASTLEHTELVLKGANLYSASISDSAHGTMRSLEHTVHALDEKLAQTERDAGECRKRATELAAKVGEPFEHEAKLKNLTQRQDEIVKSLDLTRNQASNRLDAATPPDGEEAVSEKAERTLRHRVHHTHAATVR
jgi:hypothetical protein